MFIDDFLKKHELQEVFHTELRIEREKFIEKMKEISETSFRSEIFLITDIFLPEKIKYVGDFSKNIIELRERTFPFKRYKAASVIKLALKSKNDLLLIKTSIQGISYIKFILSTLILSALLFLCVLLIFELEILPVLVILVISFFYLFITFKYSKANVQRIKKELSLFYNTIE